MTALLGFTMLVEPAAGGTALTGGGLNSPGYYQNVPRPHCGAGSNPETGFQGEVPLANRAAGFQGFSCNLQLIGQSQGEGASWQNAWYGTCDYYDTADNQGQGPTHVGAQQHLGTVVLDVANPSHPTPTAYLASPAMLHPWEDLKVNQKRGLLAGQLESGTPFDVYSVKNDCAHPVLLASVPMPTTAQGHEGEWEPDGRTYWADSAGTSIHAIDVSDPTHPKYMFSWTAPDSASTHGMSFSTDGTRGYFVTTSITPAALASHPNGFVIADISDIQFRRPHPQVREVSHVYWSDGSEAQGTIPVTIGSRKYLMVWDELGSAGLAMQSGYAYSCASGLLPYGIPRIYDITDERHPVLVSKLTLQTNQPANCATTIPECSGQVIFCYDSHYCEVDTRVNTTALACGFFNSGIRVFDVRDPYHPKEIAYFNPPAQLTKDPQLWGSEHAHGDIGGSVINADWCTSQVRFYTAADGSHELWAQCQDNGMMVLKFTNGAYPLPASGTTPIALRDNPASVSVAARAAGSSPEGSSLPQTGGSVQLAIWALAAATAGLAVFRVCPR
ncbi:MAG TPA: hypothetical protein VNG13_00110 [Mycobacteriales bacterium]|nr:hypothetical protein [Mycobacteriales bacterium]